ncbi:uncharacterized protein [Primulina eburnea]|uniref:uncharacterized protein isoform X1 n=1 Tax=Primulina eburnea TaxID=1245227 RepID=UPI003C6C0325
MDIRHYSSAVSESSSPTGILLFVDLGENIKPILQVMEYAFPIDTVIVGTPIVISYTNVQAEMVRDNVPMLLQLHLYRKGHEQTRSLEIAFWILFYTLESRKKEDVQLGRRKLDGCIFWNL